MKNVISYIKNNNFMFFVFMSNVYLLDFNLHEIKNCTTNYLSLFITIGFLYTTIRHYDWYVYDLHKKD